MEMNHPDNTQFDESTQNPTSETASVAPNTVIEPDRAESLEENRESPDQDSNEEFPESGAGLPDATQLFVYAGIHLKTTEMAKALLQVLDTHAWKNMGFVADERGEMSLDLPSAQLAIDTLAFLVGKLEKGLPPDDLRECQRRLNDLRVNYLTKSREV